MLLSTVKIQNISIPITKFHPRLEVPLVILASYIAIDFHR